MTLKTAHDVRHLCVCSVCGNVGDDREMIPRHDARYHTKCFVENFGEALVERLPRAERDKFRLCDVSHEFMCKLLDMRTEA